MALAFEQVFSGSTGDLEVFAAQVGSMTETYPNACLTGSVGRQLILAAYEQPGLSPLPVRKPDGTLRDLDVIDIHDSHPELGKDDMSTTVHLIDASMSNYVQKDGVVYIPELQEVEGSISPLDAALFQPVVRQVGGVIVANTLNATVERELQHVRGVMFNPFQLNKVRPFQEFIDTLDERALLPGDEPLPSAVYEPVSRYIAMLHTRRSARWQARLNELAS